MTAVVAAADDRCGFCATPVASICRECTTQVCREHSSSGLCVECQCGVCGSEVVAHGWTCCDCKRSMCTSCIEESRRIDGDEYCAECWPKHCETCDSCDEPVHGVGEHCDNCSKLLCEHCVQICYRHDGSSASNGIMHVASCGGTFYCMDCANENFVSCAKCQVSGCEECTKEVCKWCNVRLCFPCVRAKWREGTGFAECAQCNDFVCDSCSVFCVNCRAHICKVHLHGPCKQPDCNETLCALCSQHSPCMMCMLKE